MITDVIWSVRSLLLALASLGCCLSAYGTPVEITETEYEGRPQFKITTENAIWYYDRAGGAFSRLIDRDGHDWIAYHNDERKGPGGAAGAYRGLPKLVYGSDNPDAGAGQPGNNLCESSVAAPALIRTTTKSGRWKWTWRFNGTHAVLSMEQTDEGRPWWFAYEGPIAGAYSPRTHYRGTDLGGPWRDTPNYKLNEEITGPVRWIYLGDSTVGRVLFIAGRAVEALPGLFAYFGSTAAGITAPDGMVVVKLGCVQRRPMLVGAGGQFIIGFLEIPVKTEDDHRRVAAMINAFGIAPPGAVREFP